jgi:hypothetical protein
MQSRRTVLLAALCGSIVSALVVGGIAWASIPGPKGATINTNPPWINHAYEASGPTTGVSLALAPTTIVELDSVPAGDYVVFGSTIVFTSATNGGSAGCALKDDDRFSSYNLIADATIPVQATVHLDSSGDISMTCIGSSATVFRAHLLAIAVDAVN